MTKTQALSNFLFSGQKLAAAALSTAAATQVAHWFLEGRDYAVVAAPMPGNFADKTSGFAVLASLTDGMSRVQSEGMKVLWLGLLGDDRRAGCGSHDRAPVHRAA